MQSMRCCRCKRRPSCPSLLPRPPDRLRACASAQTRGPMAAEQTKPDAVAQALTHAALGSRYDQTFPVLTAAEIDRMRRFGTLRNYADGEKLFETGEPAPGMFVLLVGSVPVMQHDGRGHISPVIEQ